MTFRSRLVVQLLAAVLFFAPLLQAQRNPNPAAVIGSGGLMGGATTAPPGSATAESASLRYPMNSQPVYLTGRVLLEDGSTPPETVVIQRMCGGAPEPQAYTDSKGRFTIDQGRNGAVLLDAASSLDRRTLPGAQVPIGGLAACELRAYLPGFRSTSIQLGGRKFLDHPDVGNIFLKRLAHVEGLTITATSALAPKDARKAYEKGKEEARKGHGEKAEKEYEKAVSIYPEYAAAWLELGRAHFGRKEWTEAGAAFQHAIDADPKYVNPYLGLAQVAANAREWPEVVRITNIVLRLNTADFPQAWFLNSIANLALNRIDDAERSADQVVRLNMVAKFPKVEHILGLVAATHEDWPDAVGHVKRFAGMIPPGAEQDVALRQLAELEERAAAVPPAPKR